MATKYSLAMNPSERIGIAAAAAYKLYTLQHPNGPGPGSGWFQTFLAEFIERERDHAKTEILHQFTGEEIRKREEFLFESENKWRLKCEARLAAT